MDKKIGVLILTFIFVSFFVLNASFVSARSISEDLISFFNEVAKIINPVLSWILGTTSSAEFLIVKVLFFIVIFALIYSTVRSMDFFNQYEFLPSIISMTMSILAVRFLSTDVIVNFVWLPTGVLGVSMAVIFPFIIYFFFIEGFNSRIVRQVGWIVFSVIYFSLAILRWDDLKNSDIFGGISLGWIYILIGMLSLIFVFFDKYVSFFKNLTSIQTKTARMNKRNLGKFYRDLDSWEETRNAAIRLSNPKNRDLANKEIARLQKEIARLNS